MNVLGGTIRERRVELGLTVRGLATRAGVSPAYVTAIETANNPSTRRAPVPSLAIVARLAGVLDLDLRSLAETGRAAPATVQATHLLLYVLTPPPAGLVTSLDTVFGSGVDHWLHIADPRDPNADSTPRATTRRFALGSAPYASNYLQPERLIDALEREVAALGEAKHALRVGLLIADCSAVMRYVQNASAEVEMEPTWHDHVHRIWERHLGRPPAADVCAYYHDDLAALGLTIDQLATALALITHHHRVLVLDGDTVTEGPPAVRRILEQARPHGTTSESWRRLAAMAARGLAVDQRP